MPYDRTLLEKIGRAKAIPWEGEVFRHMLGNLPPERENIRGARWYPQHVPAIYTSLARGVSVAEADYHLSLQPVRPRARRVLYKIGVSLENVVDLSSFADIEALGVSRATFESTDYSSSQPVGGGAAHLGHDGMLVPSARGDGVNLVLFPGCQTSTYRFEQIDYEIISPDSF